MVTKYKAHFKAVSFILCHLNVSKNHMFAYVQYNTLIEFRNRFNYIPMLPGTLGFWSQSVT